MSCVKPLLALDNGKGEKPSFVRIRPEYSLMDYERIYGKRLLLLPCGKCIACKESKRKQWSVRCELEASQYSLNCFVTLTYEKNHIPANLKLWKKDFQNFIKAIRNRGYDVRYFGCGELGVKGRPHCHIILFGFMPSDCVYKGEKSDTDNYIYCSKFIDECWEHKGISTVQEFSPRCASYVAGYTQKEKNTAFLLMSTRPGIGRLYVEKNAQKLYVCDSVVANNRAVSLPRYFDKVLDSLGYVVDDLKDFRKWKQSILVASQMNDRKLLHKEELYRLNGEIKENKMKLLRRSL